VTEVVLRGADTVTVGNYFCVEEQVPGYKVAKKKIVKKMTRTNINHNLDDVIIITLEATGELDHGLNVYIWEEDDHYYVKIRKTQLIFVQDEPVKKNGLVILVPKKELVPIAEGERYPVRRLEQKY